jgi:hypothetical protein
MLRVMVSCLAGMYTTLCWAVHFEFISENVSRIVNDSNTNGMRRALETETDLCHEVRVLN